MPMNWTDNVDREMFLFILSESDAKVKNDIIAAHLNKVFGTETTPKAVKEHLAGIKKKHEASMAALANGEAPAATPTKKSPAKKKAAALDGDGGEDEETSPKKRKVATPRKKKAIKKSESDEDDVKDEED